MLNRIRVDKSVAEKLLPRRPENSHKGSFGRLLVITGSGTYRGAAHLGLEAALRGGVGLVSFVGEENLVRELSAKFPEVIYKSIPPLSEAGDSEISSPAELSSDYNAILVGSGSSESRGLLSLVSALLEAEGCPLILDADALNVLSREGESGLLRLSGASRPVILTPHPLEFSRLTGIPVSKIQENREELAVEFARKNGVILLLKGAGTVATDGGTVYLNTTGSSALAKAGSGDVLAGLLSSLVASGVEPLGAAALAAYLHGAAADTLEGELSAFGVTPSDLPKQIAREIATLLKNR